jgi:anti-sigma-K factor RskA
MSACEGVRELLGGYVLEALDPDEKAAVERHMETCQACRREHRELAGLPQLLALLDSPETTPEAPPASLEDAVLDRFARERRGLAARPRRRRARRIGLAAAAAGALAATALVLALAGVFSSSPGDTEFGHVRLHGAGAAMAEADLTAVRAGTSVRMSVSGLPGGGGVVYELWCVPDDGRWISGGTFRVDDEGRAHVSLTSAARPGDYEVMHVTRRGDGTRGQPVLSGNVEY